MDALTRIGWIGFIALTLAVSGCGGGGGGGGGTPPAGTVVGAAGGTVVGPNGAKVVIPAGALATDTTINIAQITTSTAVLPVGFSVSGQTFAFTPHGTTFAVPVTITLPFNPALVPAGTTPQFYKTNAQFQWEQITNAIFGADTATAQVTSFSDLAVVIPPVIPPLFRGDPVRKWIFSDFRGRNMINTELVSARQEGGVFEEFQVFGAVSRSRSGLSLDHEILSITGGVIGQDGQANGQVFSSADGGTYGAFAEAPLGNPNLADNPVGGSSQLRQFQAFIKRGSNATLSFTLTGAFVDLHDENGGFSNNSSNPKCQYPANQVGALDACQDILRGQVILLVKAYTHATSATTPGRLFFHTGGTALFFGHQGHYSQQVNSSMLSSTPLWFEKDFDVDISPNFDFAIMNFKGPRTYVVDLSGVAVNEEFTLNSLVLAEATNRQGNKSIGAREFPSAAAAFLRDPLSIGGTTLAFSGLEPIANPVLEAPADSPVEPAPCVPGPGPDPEAGVIQFSAASYTIEELGSAVQPVRITRTGGSKGAVTATFTTSDGTATAGTNYTPVNASVFFADGDAEDRLAEISIIQKLLSGDPSRTVNLTLSQPGGCAALGAQTTAVLTIEDDDLPVPPPSFTIGGTVTGLAGTGLALQHVSTGENLAAGNGPFTFLQLLPSGFGYSVAVGTQPSNPSQVCTVTNGSGVANANVTNVAVNCVTPAANGALDPTFGDAGKASTAFGGDDTAMALQADGKIVMVGGSFGDFVLARYNLDGSLDSSFGAGGLVTTDFLGNVSGNDAHGVAIQADGKIVVAGQAVVGRTANNLSNFDFALARYNADGSLDASFGSGGKVTTDFNGGADRAFALAIQPDGKIVVVGDAGFSSPIGGSVDFGIARYNANGTLDATFGNGGKLRTDIAGGIDIAHNVVVLPANGAILVSGAGTSAGDAGLDHTGLARYDTHGVLDGSFGTGGKLTLNDKRVNEGLVLQGDGKILLAGSVSVGIFPARSSHFALMRLAANGSPDNRFGNAGLVLTDFTSVDDFGRAVALQADARIVVAGQSSSQSNPNFGVVRYATDGTLDGSFGTGGKLTIDFFGSFDGAENVIVQPDGKILLGGFARNGTRTGYGLVRVLP